MTQNGIYYWSPDKQLLLDIAELRAMHPNVSIPDNADVAVLGFYPLVEHEVPAYNELTQTIDYVVQEQDLGLSKEYHRAWVIKMLSVDQIDINYANRNEQLKKAFVAEAEQMLNEFAQTKGYDDIKSAISYVNSSVLIFKQEAEICNTKRDQMWIALRAVLQEIEQGIAAVPNSFEEIKHKLPELVWE